MSHVAVLGGSTRAAEWATRLLASGFDVVVDSAEIATQVTQRWPEALRLGVFPGADISRMRPTSTNDVRMARFVQVVDGALPPGCAGLVATEATARASSPIHLLPLVEVSGPAADELSAFYTSIGMAPRPASTADFERWQLGPGVAQLANDDPDAIIALMRALRPSGIGSGAALAAHEAARLSTTHVAPWQPGTQIEAPLRLYRSQVEPDWVDYNGHMTEAAYLTAAGWASDALFRYIGDDEAYRAGGHSFYTVETHIHFTQELAVHEPFEFSTQMLGADSKRMHLLHTMMRDRLRASDDTAGSQPVCTVEQMLLHVDMNAGRACAMLPAIATAVAAIAAAHHGLARPAGVGSVMRIPSPSSPSPPRST